MHSVEEFGQVLPARSARLDRGVCRDFSPSFLSISAGLYGKPCSAGETPSVLAYPAVGCQGPSSVEINEFEDGGKQGRCRDTVIAQSAKLVCQKKR